MTAPSIQRFARVQTPGGMAYAEVIDGRAHLLTAAPWDASARPTGEAAPLPVVRPAPVAPSKIICLGVNYRDHAVEFGHELPKDPLIFMKPPSSVIGPGEAIVYPPYWTQRVDYEAELALVIATRARRVKAADADAYILGYTCLNDVTARDLQRADGQWTRGKSFDTFCPIGPEIVRGLDISKLAVACFLNGERKQCSTTESLIFKVPQIVEFVSHVMTLEPGDVIATGTPSGVGPVKPGDVVSVEIEAIGTLANPVAAG